MTVSIISQFFLLCSVEHNKNYAVSRIICFIVDRKITKAEEQEEAERLEKEKERLEAEEKETTEGKNDESDAMNGNQRANR